MSIRPEACGFVRKDAGFCEPVRTHAGAGNAAKPAASLVAIHGHFSFKEPHSPFSESGRVPPPTDAENQPLDSSARNSLICMALTCGLCGLRASSRERGRSEEWPGESGMCPGAANSGGWRSPQASAGTPNNTREPARSDKKKPQPRTVGVLIGGAGGNRTRVRKSSTTSSTCVVDLFGSRCRLSRSTGRPASSHLGFSSATSDPARHDPT